MARTNWNYLITVGTFIKRYRDKRVICEIKTKRILIIINFSYARV